MFLKKLCRFAAAVIAAVFAASIMCFPVFAVGDTCELNIPFKILDKAGDVPEGTSFIVEISSDDSPLPSKTVIQADPTGEYVFGPMILDEPGDYEYTIKEHPSSNSKIRTDKTVYTVHAVAMYDDDGKLVSAFSVTKNGSPVKPTEIIFENGAVKRDPPSSSESEPESSSKPESSSDPDPSSGSSSDDSSEPDTKPQTGAKLSFVFPALLLPILAAIAIAGRRKDDEDTNRGSPPDDKTG